jgi:hypothetical protein
MGSIFCFSLAVAFVSAPRDLRSFLVESRDDTSFGFLQFFWEIFSSLQDFQYEARDEMWSGLGNTRFDCLMVRHSGCGS